MSACEFLDEVGDPILSLLMNHMIELCTQFPSTDVTVLRVLASYEYGTRVRILLG